MAQDNYIVINNFDEEKVEIETEFIDDPLILSKKLHQLILKLKGQNYMNEKEIDYKKLIESELFIHEYIPLTKQLKKVNLDKLIDTDNNQNNLLSFFINIYNSLNIHAIAYLFMTDSKLKEKKELNILDQVGGKFWTRMAYKIDKYFFSLDDIEHGILRANRPHPTTKIKSFDLLDERSKFVVKEFNSRIHFALNCGAKGCPPISFYSPDNVKKGLDIATINFCTNETEFDSSKKEISLPRLFLWYKIDFICEKENDLKQIESLSSAEQDELLIKYIFKHLKYDDEKYNLCRQILDGDNLKKYKINYSSYNWAINSRN